MSTLDTIKTVIAKIPVLNKFSIPSLRTIIQTLAIAAVGAFLGRFIPWWGIVPAFAVIGCWLGKSPSESFAMGTVAGTAIWAGYAGVLDNANVSLLSNKIGMLLTKGTGSITGMQLVIYCGMMGGLLAALGAWTGSLLRRSFQG